jgi:N,N'-diacetyllegionaminate synthase
MANRLNALIVYFKGLCGKNVSMKLNESASQIRLGKRNLSSDNPCFIIAEAGVNHNGQEDLAYRLIDQAAAAKADAVKFQLFSPENLVLAQTLKTNYQQRSTGNKGTQLEMLKSLALPIEIQSKLKVYAETKGLEFLTTPFDNKSLGELQRLDLIAIKVASTDLTNIPFLKKIASCQKPMLLSTGMSFSSEVQLALAQILPINPNVVLLQCTANYPTNDEEANLCVLEEYKKLCALVGFSDHTRGIGASPYAVAMGAKVIEKHFTLDRSMSGPDHHASLEPKELISFVAAIRQTEKFMGSSNKLPTLSELNTREKLQKFLVTNRAIGKGEVIDATNVVAMRTGGTGISPIYFDSIFGKKINKDLEANTPLLLENIEH